MVRSETFWSRIDRLKKDSGFNSIYRQYVLPAMEGNPTAVPDRLARAYKLVVDVEKLYWDADYHGLDCNGQSCDCLVTTHEKRMYPALWKKLKKMERLAKSEPSLGLK
jgi:hypothetical protein